MIKVKNFKPLRTLYVYTPYGIVIEDYEIYYYASISKTGSIFLHKTKPLKGVNSFYSEMSQEAYVGNCDLPEDITWEDTLIKIEPVERYQNVK